MIVVSAISAVIGIGIGSVVIGWQALKREAALKAAHRESYGTLYDRYLDVCGRADHYDEQRHRAEQRAAVAEAEQIVKVAA